MFQDCVATALSVLRVQTGTDASAGRPSDTEPSGQCGTPSRAAVKVLRNDIICRKNLTDLYSGNLLVDNDKSVPWVSRGH